MRRLLGRLCIFYAARKLDLEKVEVKSGEWGKPLVEGMSFSISHRKRFENIFVESSNSYRISKRDKRLSIRRLYSINKKIRKRFFRNFISPIFPKQISKLTYLSTKSYLNFPLKFRSDFSSQYLLGYDVSMNSF